MKLLVSQSKCSGTRTLRYQQFEMNLDSEISGVYCIKVHFKEVAPKRVQCNQIIPKYICKITIKINNKKIKYAISE